MNNDLISRSALKDALSEAHINRTLTFDIATFGCVMKIIDNAPTVEEKSYEMGYQDGCEDGLQGIRPQGKWKITDSYPHKVYCDKCFKTYAQANWEVWKDGTLAREFCPNCGADMRKGGAE